MKRPNRHRDAVLLRQRRYRAECLRRRKHKTMCFSGREMMAPVLAMLALLGGESW